MTGLADFSKDEAELIVSLPFKVGAWVSAAEDEEGQADDVLELKALEGCIRAVADLHADKPFIKAVAAETLKRRADWPRWEEDCFHVPREAVKAVALLRGKVPAQQLKNYRAMLMEIAKVVAMAAGEFNQYDDADESFFGKIAAVFKSMSHDDSGHPMNISPAEDSALSDLAAALRPPE